jgi:hypothetical protein
MSREGYHVDFTTELSCAFYDLANSYEKPYLWEDPYNVYNGDVFQKFGYGVGREVYVLKTPFGFDDDLFWIVTDVSL